MRGIPAPFPLALGDNFLGRGLVVFNSLLIKLNKGFFSYQMFVRAQAKPTVPNLLIETIDTSDALKKQAAASPI